MNARPCKRYLDFVSIALGRSLGNAQNFRTLLGTQTPEMGSRLTRQNDGSQGA